jgi:hypothetical protein
MIAPKSTNPAEFLQEQAASADADLLRAMVKTFADMSWQAAFVSETANPNTDNDRKGS